MTTYEPSKYQRAILEFVATNDGNALIGAVAGSGKTSTLVMLANAISPEARSVFLAFNKSIATELKQRLPGHVDSATFHSVCFRAYARNTRGGVAVDDKKVQKIWDNYQSLDPTIEPMRQGCIRLVGLAKASALLPTASREEFLNIVEHHGIDFAEDAPDDEPRDYTDEAIAIVRCILAENNRQLNSIDFDDMLYLTCIMATPLQKYDFVMVDEAQDTNEVQRLLLKRLLDPDAGRLIAVGDDAQAIYGFRGADSDAMALIERDFQCTRLPLSISYRCPRKVVELAQSIVPGIEYRPDAPDGVVDSPPQLPIKSLTLEDLIVCRNTAPLITLAYKCIGERVPVKIMGRDIGTGLVALVKKMRPKGKGAVQLENLRERLTAYKEREVASAMRQQKESKAQAIDDKVTSLFACIDGLTADEVENGTTALIASINSIFSDSDGTRKCTTLATVHKSKGLEAQRVIILDPQLMPSKWARQPWQQQQELNLKYVAYTRALDTLLMVESDQFTNGNGGTQ